jgi:uncharacterized protein (TIRG00374 family)
LPKADETSEPIGRLVRRSWKYTVLLALAALVLLVALGARADWPRLMAAVARIRWRAVLAVTALACTNYFLRSVRFSYFLRRFGYGRPLRELVPLYVAGFAGSATPGKLGELLRMWLMKLRYGVPYGVSLSVFVGDRGTDALATTLLCILTVHSFASYLWMSILFGFIFAAGAFVLARPALLLRLVDHGPRGGRFQRFGERVRRTIHQTARLFAPTPLLVGTAIGCVGWLLECVGFHIVAAEFSSSITVFQAIFIFTFANLVGALTLIPAGIGGTEVSMATLLVAKGLTLDESVATMAIVRGATLWFGIGCGYVALLFCYPRRTPTPGEDF